MAQDFQTKKGIFPITQFSYKLRESQNFRHFIKQTRTSGSNKSKQLSTPTESHKMKLNSNTLSNTRTRKSFLASYPSHGISQMGMNAVQASSNTASASPTANESLNIIINRLSRLETKFNQRYQPTRSQSQGHSHGKTRDKSKTRNEKLCFYHNRFGKKARKCTFPCKWKNPDGTSDN